MKADLCAIRAQMLKHLLYTHQKTGLSLKYVKTLAFLHSNQDEKFIKEN